MSLFQEKLFQVQNPWYEIMKKGKVTVRELSKLIRRLSSSAIVVLLATIAIFHINGIIN